MSFSQADMDAILSDTTKLVTGNIEWTEDEDHSPSKEFTVAVDSESGYPLVIRGSFNPEAKALSYVLIHARSRRIYALDMGKDHHNPTRQNVGEKHKHRWTDKFRDKEAYVPDDITCTIDDPVALWAQFCQEAQIVHAGTMLSPIDPQTRMF